MKRSEYFWGESDSLLKEQVRNTAANVPMTMGTLVFTWTLTAFFVAGHVPQRNLVAWCLFILAAILLRVVYYVAFRKVASGAFEAPRWRNLYLLGTFFSGLAWGSSAWLLFGATTHVETKILLMFVTGGMAVGVSMSHTTMRHAAVAWFAPAILSYTVVLFTEGVAVSGNLVGYSLIYFGTLYFFTMRHQRSVTELMKDRIEHHDLLDKFNIMVETAPIGIAFAHGTRFFWTNRAARRILGWAEDHEGEIDIASLFDGTEENEHAQSTSQTKIEAGGTVEMTVPMRKRNGERFWVKRIGRAVDPSDISRGVIWALEDISEKVLKEKELHTAKNQAEAANKLKDQFLTLISHDLRSPLVSMKEMIDMARKESPGGVEEMGRDRMLDRVAATAERMISFTERLLDQTRLQTGDIKPEMRFVNARSLVNSRIDNISQLATVKNITINNTLPKSMYIYADPDLYGVVIHNLLTNAVKFTPKGGEVTIFPEGESSIIIRDNGLGIDEKMLPHLFKSDIRTTTLGTDGEWGTGLGLPHSFNIMEAHGGTLTVESAKGSGAEFHAILPKNAIVILVIGDHEVQREMIKGMLAKLNNVRVVEARNGPVALETLQHITPAIIVTDIQVPEMDGLELVRRIRSMPQFEIIPIMAVTALADANPGELRERLFELGADDFIAKPVAEKEFLAAVARYIGMA